MKHSWTNSLNLSFSLRVRNIRVKGREIKCFNAIAGGEGPKLYVLQQIFRVLQKPHLSHTTSRLASFTVALKPGFDRQYNIPHTTISSIQ
jgi:hypothetical protein